MWKMEKFDTFLFQLPSSVLWNLNHLSWRQCLESTENVFNWNLLEVSRCIPVLVGEIRAPQFSILKFGYELFHKIRWRLKFVSYPGKSIYWKTGKYTGIPSKPIWARKSPKAGDWAKKSWNKQWRLNKSWNSHIEKLW